MKDAIKGRLVWIAIGALALSGCTRARDSTGSAEGKGMSGTKEQAAAVATLREAYAAFNRRDMDAAVAGLDAQIEWSEPAEFPGGGAYHGREAVKGYLTQSRANWAEGASEPEQMIPVGDRIVVMVNARFRLKRSEAWQDVKLADVYTVREGKIVAMRAFADRQEALRWVGK
jgi:ketosteroid isomerase-like protein